MVFYHPHYLLFFSLGCHNPVQVFVGLIVLIDVVGVAGLMPYSFYNAVLYAAVVFIARVWKYLECAARCRFFFWNRCHKASPTAPNVKAGGGTSYSDAFR